MSIVQLRDTKGNNSQNFIMDNPNEIYQKCLQFFGSVLVAAAPLNDISIVKSFMVRLSFSLH